MDKIPKKIKERISIISVITFLILTFGFGPTNLFGLSETIQENTEFFFGVTIYFLDYLLISLIPFFGMKLNSKRESFKLTELIMDILVILFSTMILFVIGLYILTFIGKPSSSLMPQHLIVEPIFVYSVLFLAIGIGVPFLMPHRKYERK